MQTYARTDEQAAGILDNRFYRNIAGALSGTQEYMAMEKLYELHDRGGFDLIVVDTPPTRHALDFLDAPRRLTRLLDNRVFRMLMVPTRGVVRVGGMAAQAFLRTISRVVGRRGGRRRDRVLPRVRRDGRGLPRPRRAGHAAPRRRTTPRSCSSPRRGATRWRRPSSSPAGWPTATFAVDALIVNRVHERYCDTDPDALREHARELAGRRSEASARLATHYANLADFEEVAVRERAELAGLEDRIGDASVAHVPELGHDVHDFAALRAVGDHLMGAD